MPPAKKAPRSHPDFGELGYTVFIVFFGLSTDWRQQGEKKVFDPALGSHLPLLPGKCGVLKARKTL